MKKILAVVLSMTMSVAVLSACSSSGNTGEPVFIFSVKNLLDISNFRNNNINMFI